MSDYLHSYLSVTQYVAPLMANFDSTIGNDSYVFFELQSESFTMKSQCTQQHIIHYALFVGFMTSQLWMHAPQR